MDELFGLPAHPLLVHIPVVLLPLAAVGSVVTIVDAGHSGADSVWEKYVDASLPGG